MRNLAYAVATAACLTVGAVPAAQAQMPFVGVATNYDRVVVLRRHYHPNVRRVEIRRGYHSYASADVCRSVTVRRHLRNGDVVVRHINRC